MKAKTEFKAGRIYRTEADNTRYKLIEIRGTADNPIGLFESPTGRETAVEISGTIAYPEGIWKGAPRLNSAFWVPSPTKFVPTQLYRAPDKTIWEFVGFQGDNNELAEFWNPQTGDEVVGPWFTSRGIQKCNVYSDSSLPSRISADAVFGVPSGPVAQDIRDLEELMRILPFEMMRLQEIENRTWSQNDQLRRVTDMTLRADRMLTWRKVVD